MEDDGANPAKAVWRTEQGKAGYEEGELRAVLRRMQSPQRFLTPAKKRHVFSKAAANRFGARRYTNSLANEPKPGFKEAVAAAGHTFARRNMWGKPPLGAGTSPEKPPTPPGTAQEPVVSRKRAGAGGREGFQIFKQFKTKPE